MHGMLGMKRNEGIFTAVCSIDEGVRWQKEFFNLRDQYNDKIF